MAGTIDLIQRCYTGLELRGDALRLNPAIPPEMVHLALTLSYRSHLVRVRVSNEQVQVSVELSLEPPITVDVRGDRRRLAPGETAIFDLTGT